MPARDAAWWPLVWSKTEYDIRHARIDLAEGKVLTVTEEVADEPGIYGVWGAAPGRGGDHLATCRDLLELRATLLALSSRAD